MDVSSSATKDDIYTGKIRILRKIAKESILIRFQVVTTNVCYLHGCLCSISSSDSFHSFSAVVFIEAAMKVQAILRSVYGVLVSVDQDIYPGKDSFSYSGAIYYDNVSFSLVTKENRVEKRLRNEEVVGSDAAV